MSEFPIRRMRRLRRTAALRGLRRETRLCVDDFVQPIFVAARKSIAGEVASMPGVSRYTLDELAGAVESIKEAGVSSVLIFGVPATKDATASGISAARGEEGIVARAVGLIKTQCPDMAVITDVCVCGYIDHGHCGVIASGEVANDASLELLAGMALSHARAGADLVAPSAMMDGMVGAIRRRLDEAGFIDTGILSYAAKYASSFYGPFREATGSAPRSGDRRGYQMDPANAAEALAEARLDVAEGADMIMVKPALAYLDVIRRVKDAVPDVPLAAYQVSGEYSMVKAAAQRGWLNECDVALETLTSIKRAGADVLITYWASEAAKWL